MSEPPPTITLPPIPHDANTRAALLERIAAEIVEQFGPTAAQALAAWVDEVVEDRVDR